MNRREYKVTPKYADSVNGLLKALDKAEELCCFVYAVSPEYGYRYLVTNEILELEIVADYSSRVPTINLNEADRKLQGIKVRRQWKNPKKIWR